MKKPIPYGRQTIDAQDLKTVLKVLQSDFLTQGPAIAQFEEALAKWVGAKYCVVVNSGTAALHVAYFACGFKEGDELITSPMTFAATSNAALYLNGKVKFVDIEPDTGNIDVTKVEKAVTSKTKIVAPIHYGGQPADLKSLAALKKKHGFKIVEDACHALGAVYHRKLIGSCAYSDATVFSFHPVKHITTGEGGAVLTNDKEVYERALLFRTHGITKDAKDFSLKTEGDWYYEMKALGFNYRLPDIQAALGLSQLKKLSKFLTQRRQIATRYDQAFKDSPYVETPPLISDSTHAYHLYPIRLRDSLKLHKKTIFQRLRERGLGVQVHYVPVHWHPYYQSLGFKKGSLPRAEDFYQRVISLPMYPLLTRVQQEQVIKVVNEVCHEFES